MLLLRSRHIRVQVQNPLLREGIEFLLAEHFPEAIAFSGGQDSFDLLICEADARLVWRNEWGGNQIGICRQEDLAELRSALPGWTLVDYGEIDSRLPKLVADWMAR